MVLSKPHTAFFENSSSLNLVRSGSKNGFKHEAYLIVHTVSLRVDHFRDAHLDDLDTACEARASEDELANG
jgi:hypothetical protein